MSIRMRSFVGALTVLLLTAGTVECRAQSAGAFSRLGFGARGIAMSNALVADASGAASPYYNPALAPSIADQHVEATAALLSLDRELQFLQFGTPLQPRAGIAAGLIHAGVRDIDGRDGSGYHTQTYSTDEYAFFLAFGVRFTDRVQGGVGLQYFRADLADGLAPSNSIGLDIGIMARLTRDLSIGIAVDDLLARYTWDSSDLYGNEGRSTTDRFPIRIRIGGAYRFMEGRGRVVAEYESSFRSAETHAVELVLDGNAVRQVVQRERLMLQQNQLRAGGELLLVDPFTVRVGIDRIGDTEIGAITPTGGFMLEQPVGELGVRAEYAIVLEPYAAGTMHFITLQILL